MTEEIIKLLLPEIQASCPENVRLSIRKIPLNNVRALYLLIIQYNTNITDVEEWAIYEVYHRYHKIFEILDKNGLSGIVRLLFCNQNDFVLYTPLQNTVLNEFDGLVFRACCGYDRQEHLVGKTYNIDKLINYLINRRKNF